jgi:hypothetical protein
VSDPIKVKSITQVGVSHGTLSLEADLGNDNFQVIEFNWRDFASVYEYITSEGDHQSAPDHECKDCPKCKHPDCRHAHGLCNYARDCACDYYVKGLSGD